MDPLEYESLVRRLEQNEATHPLLYRIRIVLLAIVGYLYPVIVLGLLAGIVVLIAMTKIYWVAGNVSGR